MAEFVLNIGVLLGSLIGIKKKQKTENTNLGRKVRTNWEEMREGNYNENILYEKINDMKE